ncbi:MAG: hypothetical protein JNJ61_16280 [Anaerolineae bacterium]|nr:hypothetical protein [Anaerolineae bacterium]
MTFIELGSGSPDLSYRQRASHVIALAFAVFALVIGYNLRNTGLFSTTRYENVEAGIRAEYPRNWLFDNQGDYVFRVRNMTRVGFKTTIQVELRPVGAAGSTRSILDAISLERFQSLAAYQVINVDASTPLADDIESVTMAYTYADTDRDPFLQSIPTVVRGVDILAVRGGQVVIITFLADATTFESDYAFFERFLSGLEFR